MKFNFFQLLILGGALAQAIDVENAPGAEKSGRRARAAHATVAALGSFIPGVSEDPANIDDAGQIIDAIVRIQNRVKSAQKKKEATVVAPQAPTPATPVA